jgi:hypothetical protein
MYVLVIIAVGMGVVSPISVTTHEFQGRETCEAVKTDLERDRGRFSIVGVCYPK